MVAFLIRRSFGMVIVLLAVSFVTYLIFFKIPGGDVAGRFSALERPAVAAAWANPPVFDDPAALRAPAAARRGRRTSRTSGTGSGSTRTSSCSGGT